MTPKGWLPMQLLNLVPGAITLAQLRTLWATSHALSVDGNARAGVDAAAATVAEIVATHRTVYGVNTGFGLLARTRIDDARLAELQLGACSPPSPLERLGRRPLGCRPG